MIEAIALAFGLAMDATAMAAVRGLNGSRREAVLLPLLFGVFQAGMAALGWALGAWGGKYIEAWDHWIAAGLLFLIGGKFLVDAWRDLRTGEREDDEEVPPRANLLVLFGLALATSIDAAAAGITLPLLSVSPVTALGLIGGVTFACAFVGFAAGRSAGRHLGGKLSILGGVLLIAIGVRILVEHTLGEEPPVPATTASDSADAPSPPRRTTTSLDAAALAELATLEIPGWTKHVATTEGRLEVSYTRAGHTVTVSVAPCFDCPPMDLEAWRAKEPALQLLVPAEHRDQPGTRWELGAIELGGEPLVFTYHHAGGTGAYALYWNDGTNQIRAVVEAPAEPPGEPSSREELSELARTFVRAFTDRW